MQSSSNVYTTFDGKRSTTLSKLAFIIAVQLNVELEVKHIFGNPVCRFKKKYLHNSKKMKCTDEFQR